MVILQFFWMMFIIQTTDAQEFISEDIIEQQTPSIETWFILYDGEIVLELETAKDIEINGELKYIAFNGDIIYNNGFEEETIAEKVIREYEN